jgi:hypothetical protein
MNQMEDLVQLIVVEYAHGSHFVGLILVKEA